MAKIIDINLLKPTEQVEPAFYRRYKDILKKQGQIVPMLVTEDFEIKDYCDLCFYYAAKELGWEALLITTEDKSD